MAIQVEKMGYIYVFCKLTCISDKRDTSGYCYLGYTTIYADKNEVQLPKINYETIKANLLIGKMFSRCNEQIICR